MWLTEGDQIGFHKNILRKGLSIQLWNSLVAGYLVVADSGGSIGIVDYEILPHANRLESSFLQKVHRYSWRIAHDVIGLADGAA
jgi:hypothetical protein